MSDMWEGEVISDMWEGKGDEWMWEGYIHSDQ